MPYPTLPPPPSEGRAPAGKVEQPRAYYIYDDQYGGGDEAEVTVAPPENGTHTVRRGDTLWDLCAYYFGDPWLWPEVWSLNPSITNPHWIYPGNLVRLRRDDGSAPVAATPTPDGGEPPPITQRPERRNTLRQLAFASTADLKESGVVRGSTEEKELLSEGDELYIDYAAGKPPQVGKRYAVYSPTQKLVNPKTKAQVGAYVLVRGEVLILEVKKGKNARGRLLYSTNTDPVERENRVGPIRSQFKDVPPVAARKNLDTTIVGLLGTDQVAGEEQVVFLDRGKQDGLVPGNLLYVVRRGDAYDTKYGHYSPAGRNDPHYPDFALAQVIVVDVADKTAVALVTRSRQELMPGDRALLRTASR